MPTSEETAIAPRTMMLRELTGNPVQPHEMTQEQRENACHCGAYAIGRADGRGMFVCTRCGDPLPEGTAARTWPG